MAVFTLQDALSVQTDNASVAVFILQSYYVWVNLGKHLKFVLLWFTCIKTGTRRIMRMNKLSFVRLLERRTTKGSSPGRIMRLVPVLILETRNQTNYKVFAQVTAAALAQSVERLLQSGRSRVRFPGPDQYSGS